jgi:hypothetical protein
MKTFKLTKETFIEYTKIDTNLSYILIDNLDSLEKNINSIKTLIDYFNKEYKWDVMFNVDDVYDRIKDGHGVFICYYKNYPIGYMWFKELDKDNCFTYNLYVTNIVERPKYTSYWFYNQTNKMILKKFKEIKMEIFEWNVSAIKIVHQSGAKCLTIL